MFATRKLAGQGRRVRRRDCRRTQPDVPSGPPQGIPQRVGGPWSGGMDGKGLGAGPHGQGCLQIPSIQASEAHSASAAQLLPHGASSLQTLPSGPGRHSREPAQRASSQLPPSAVTSGLQVLSPLARTQLSPCSQGSPAVSNIPESEVSRIVQASPPCKAGTHVSSGQARPAAQTERSNQEHPSPSCFTPNQRTSTRCRQVALSPRNREPLSIM
jgi:hypothetical protein